MTLRKRFSSDPESCRSRTYFNTCVSDKKPNQQRQPHHNMNTAARGITVLCFVWIFVFCLLVGFKDIKPFFSQFVGHFFADKKGGTPIIFLALPILLAGTVGSILAKQYPEGAGSNMALPRQLPPRLQVLIHAVRSLSGGDLNMDAFSFWFIFCPLVVYIAASLDRKISALATDDDPEHQTPEYRVMVISNIFAMAAIFALSVFLVPVARHSAVLAVLGWSPARAVRMHIWAGRIVVGGVTIHGALYLYSWKFLESEGWYLLIPPAQCWTDHENYTPTHCRREETDCSCDDHFRNLTGLLAALGLLIIAVTSLNSIRRRVYYLFYRVHVISGPLVLLLVVLHYHRAMIYLGGGLLYYMASTFSVWVENRIRARRGGVRVVSVQRLTSSTRPCVSLTLEAAPTAISRYRAGQYVKLYVPSISTVSHPFTINAVSGQASQLRIIFRDMGPFTAQLARALTNSPEMPLISLEGFFGSPYRTQQVLQHDTVVLVAGGIGITPYLSLLDRVHTTLSNGSAHSTKRVILHWLCRDASLIEYVQKQYLDTLLATDATTGFQMNLVIHNTATSAENGMVSNITSFSDLHLAGDAPHDLNENDSARVIAAPTGNPFSPSVFAAASKNTYKGNLPLFVSFSVTAWIGLMLVWYCYAAFPVDDIVFARIWGPCAVATLSVVVAVMGNVLYRLLAINDEDAAVSPTWTAVDSHQDDDDDNNGFSLEMTKNNFSGANHSSSSKPSASDNVAVTSDCSAVSLETKQGRPQVPQLVRSLAPASNPGLFVCGPEALVSELKLAIGHGSLWNPQRYLPRKRRISLYEESFHL